MPSLLPYSILERAGKRLFFAYRLFRLYVGSNFLQLCNHLVGIFLAYAFLNRLGSGVNQLFCFFQAQARDFSDDLDNLDLLSASGLQDLSLIHISP